MSYVLDPSAVEQKQSHDHTHQASHDNPHAHTLQHTGPTSSAYDLNKVEAPYSAYNEKRDEGNVSPNTRVGTDSAIAVSNVFSELDEAPISWFHIKTVMIAGMGFFCDAYDLFSISLVSKTIGRVYYPDTSYNCIPCPASSDVTSDKCLAASSGANCVKLLEYLNIVDSSGNFMPGYDNTGKGWASVENNGISGKLALPLELLVSLT